MDLNAPIFVAGHRGLVGSALVRELVRLGAKRVLVRSREELDLTDATSVDGFFAATRPHYVFLAAAKVGGIRANDAFPAEFLRDNLAIQTNTIHSAWRHGVRKLCFLGSSCIYPRLAPQPLKEEYLLTGPLEATNEWYAIAKIAGIKMCQAYRRQYGFDAISLMPTNLYGPNDNFDQDSSHVLPAMIRRFDAALHAGASEVTIWGTGTPRREFLHVDDMAAATVYLMQNYSGHDFINVGVGSDVSILDLARLVARATGFRGNIRCDPTQPDGTPRKLMDISRLAALGWMPSISLERGIADTIAWYRSMRVVAPPGSTHPIDTV